MEYGKAAISEIVRHAPEAAVVLASLFGGGNSTVGGGHQSPPGAIRGPQRSTRVQLSGQGGSVVTTTKKRKKKGKGKKIIIKKKVKKAIKRIAKSADKQLIGVYSRNLMNAITNAVNKVNWQTLLAKTRTDWLTFLNSEVFQNQVSGGVVQDGTTVEVTQVPSAGKGKAYRIQYEVDFWVKNNWASPCEATFYMFTCNAETTNDPGVELDNFILNDEATLDPTNPSGAISAALTKENDFSQYFYTKRMQGRVWEIKKRIKAVMEPGNELKFTFKHSFIYYQSIAASSQNYMKNQPYLMCRIMGVPCHDSVTASIVGMSPSQLDVLLKERIKVYSIGPERIAIDRITLANAGFGSVSIGRVAEDSVVQNAAG